MPVLICLVVTGITPAHAGKRLTRALRPVTPWDHPRTRGEKLRILRRPRVVLGSPPHTRGKEWYIKPEEMESRITPAHAGKRQKTSFHILEYGDHPRTRGEKNGISSQKKWKAGSPPHTRGKATFHASVSTLYRITPAHAGKRSNGFKRNCGRWDHPRTRGEKTKKIPIKPRFYSRRKSGFI